MALVDRVFQIFELLRENAWEGQTNKEISKKLNIPAPTTSRLLTDLQKYNYVYKEQGSHKYFLGHAFLRLSQAVTEKSDDTTITAKYLDKLHLKTGLTVDYVVYRNEGYGVVFEVRGVANTRIAVAPGELMPLYCTATGRAILAFLPEAERYSYYNDFPFKKYTDDTITDIDQIENELKKIRQTYVAFNFGEFNEGINTIATPIFDRKSRVVGSVAIEGTSVSLSLEKMEKFKDILLQTCTTITNELQGSYIHLS